MKQSGSLIYLLGFIIVISAAILVTSLGQGKDVAEGNSNESVQTEANIEVSTETEGDNPDDSATEETGNEDALLSRGEEIVKQKCIACHGGNLEGGRGPELQTVGSRLTQEDIEGILRDGNKTMPPNLLKSDEDVIAAAQYLSTLK